MISGVRFVGSIAVILLLAIPALVHGRQQVPPPVIPAAETLFLDGLRSFDAESYEDAYRLFMQAVSDHGFNRRTTAAHIMAGKALLAMGHFDGVVDLMDRFISEYPGSTYLDEARLTRRQAADRLERLAELNERTIGIGILLPTTPDLAAHAQSLFDGIRVAVNMHNSDGPYRPARMIFRDTGPSNGGVEGATRSLIESGGIDVIVGPLTSGEAEAAGGITEQAGIPMIAPLATEDGVVHGRNNVFLANPSWSMRGRLMARFAIESLRMQTLGVITEAGTFGEDMAHAFRDEAERLGREVLVFEILPGAEGWAQIASYTTADTLAQLSGLYLPVTGQDAPTDIRRALTSLNQMGARTRILGNAEWHGLAISREASAFRTVYTSDIWVNEGSQQAQQFTGRYREISDEEPDRLAFAGYDVTRFLLTRIENKSEDQTILDIIRQPGTYQGVGGRIDFADGPINQGVFFIEYRATGPRLMR